MARRASKVTTRAGKDAPPEPLAISIGWPGQLGEIVAILERGYAPNNLPARPARQMILARLAASADLARALGRGDRSTAERIARRLAAAVLGPGVKPVNAPSTARRKGGDRRALRNTRGRDAIFKKIRILVRKLKSGRFS